MPWIAGDAWVRDHGIKLVEGEPNEHVPVGTALSVLRDVLSHMKRDLHVASLSVRTIAKETGWSVSTTKLALHALERSGYLARTQPVQNGRLGCSLWVPGGSIPDPLGGSDPDPGVGQISGRSGSRSDPKGSFKEKRSFKERIAARSPQAASGDACGERDRRPANRGRRRGDAAPVGESLVDALPASLAIDGLQVMKARQDWVAMGKARLQGKGK